MKWSVRIATLLGIPIYLHFTFLLILPLFAWVFATQSVTLVGFQLGFGGLDLGFLPGPWAEPVRYALGTLAAVLFFGSVLLHELGHSAVALRFKTQIRAIVLIIFGGISQMEDIPRESGKELRIAVAGPAVNFVIGGVGFGVMQLPLAGIAPALEAVAVMLSIVVFYNLVLGLFNLVPAFPMDGGRILRSTLSRRLSYLNATEISAAVGKVFAFAFGIVGLLVWFNPWLILIAFFVWLGAGEEERLTKLTVTLEGVWVEDVMTREVATVSGDASVSELLDRMVRERHMGYPVVNGELRGMVTFNDASDVPPNVRDRTRVEEICTRDVHTVAPRDQAMDALRLMSRHDVGRLPVVDHGDLVGILTRTDLVKAVNVLKLQRGI